MKRSVDFSLTVIQDVDGRREDDAITLDCIGDVGRVPRRGARIERSLREARQW